MAIFGLTANVRFRPIADVKLEAIKRKVKLTELKSEKLDEMVAHLRH